jgi:phosphoribosylformylglycinamidine synthase
VQVGDPFMEKLLLEACLEAMKTGAIVGIQDMGAAGLTSSSCEMGARGGVGLEMNLDYIPQRETGMTAYEMMLSESQERMLLVADKGREQEVLDVFTKWGLDATIVGTVVSEPRLRILHHGELVADIPNQSLTDDAPRYHRPIGEWKAPVSTEPTRSALNKLGYEDKTSGTRDYTEDLRTLLASANICCKRWVHEQYDTMVQTNTVQGPGAEGGVMRIKGTKRGLSMALDGNSRWSYLDPKLGASHAVAEAARKVACTGATPIAATNCLNFGNPEKPEIMAQFSAAIDGISEACIALGTPITGGNVSLYNETRGEGIYPTPVLGIVGLLEDVTKTVPAAFQKSGDAVLVIAPAKLPTIEDRLREFGSSEYAKTVLGELWGTPPSLNLNVEANLHKCLAELADAGLLHSASDISDGGIAVALAEGSFGNGIGVTAHLQEGPDLPVAWQLFGETATQVVVTCDASMVEKIKAVVAKHAGLMALYIGETEKNLFRIKVNGKTVIDETVLGLQHVWAGALEAKLYDEVIA